MVMSPPENTQRLMPRLAYLDAPAAIEFLCRAFGFEEIGRFAPGGKVVYSEIALNGETLFAIGSSHEGVQSPRELSGLSIELFCYVDDVDRHYAQAKAAGATILNPPEDKFWGDRSYAVMDCEGYRWIFRKIVKNVRLTDSKPK
ncbi:MAG: VOC family protein [Terriglobia bacterium]